MPVTAKLSRRFYETFGDEIANELEAKTDRRFAELEAKTDRHFSDLEARFPQLEAKFERRLAEVAGGLRSEIASVRADLIKWMFIFWAGNVVTTAGLVLGAVSLPRR